MEKARSLNDDWFVRNAIYCWMHHFPEHQWTPIYEQLLKRDTINVKQPAKRGRPAKRARTPNPDNAPM